MSLLSAWALSAALFLAAWLACRRIRNHSYVDAVWAGGFTVLVACYSASGGYWPRKLLVGGAFVLWSVRLSSFLFRRISEHHPREDERYAKLRAQWGDGWRFFLFFQVQALLLWSLSIPAWFAAKNPSPSLSWPEWLGAAVWLTGVVGEALADAQKKRFRAGAANLDRVCDVGLWRYSRHPNYFFESVIWWGYFAMACGSPGGAITIYCPLLMLYLLLKVSGVPLAEEQSLRARGDAFRKYQRRVSVFVPLPNKRSRHE